MLQTKREKIVKYTIFCGGGQEKGGGDFDACFKKVGKYIF
jgi:hypothetical protein